MKYTILVKTKKGYIKTLEPLEFTKNKMEAMHFSDLTIVSPYLKNIKMAYGKITIIREK